MNKWAKFGLYMLIAFVLFLLGHPTQGLSDDAAANIESMLGAYSASFLVVAVVGEIIVAICRA